MNKTVLKVSLVYIIFMLIGINAYSLDVKAVNFQNGAFNLNYISAKKLTYNKMLFDNPKRLIIDIFNVSRCSLCKKGILRMANESIKARISFHGKKSKDVVYYKYKKPVLRVVFSFEELSQVPNYKIIDKPGDFRVSFAKIRRGENVLERVSFRKFKTYEMVVALLKKKPSYQVYKDKNVVYLTIKNAVATDSALEEQALSDISKSIASINPVKVAKNITKYAIYMKSAALFKRDYSDKRHIYLIFELPKTGQKSAAVDKVKELKTKKKTTISENNHKKKPQYTGKKISFNVRNADIHDIFRVFSQISGLNFITSNDVKGTLTMELKDVPWDQAFALILQQKGLVAEKEGNIIRITTASQMQREKSQELKAIQEKQELERAKNAITEVISLNYITPDYAMKIVNNLLYKKKSQSGFVVADMKNNAVICHDTKQNIEKIKQIISTIDKRKKAVEIDARIVEINKTFERQLGIQWGGAYYNAGINNSSTFFGIGGATSPVSINSAGNHIAPSANFQSNNFAVNLPTTLSDAPVSSMSLAIGNVLANYNLDLKLTAGEVEGYSKVLSSPRVITLDNEPAKIESGQEIPYQESAGASGATSVSFKNATLSLEVTPHITNNNQIILKIKVSKDSPDFAHAVNGEPPINTNTVDTTVVLSNGQTVVLGGLIQKTNLKSTSGVPGLMRIPLLGWLFKTKRYYNPENELFIFVTPKIVKSN